MRRVAIIVSCTLIFLTACSIGAPPTPAPPTPTPANRQAQIAQMTQVAVNLAATAESKAATATAAAIPTIAPTPTATVARPTPTATVPLPPTAVAQAPTGPSPDLAENLADFRMETYQGDASMGGHETQLSNAFAFGLPVVLNFWAPLCPPCRAEMPAFQRVSDDYAGQVFFLGVDVSSYMAGFGGADEARELIRDTGIRYPVTYAVDSPVEAYKLRAIPTTVFFTADGKIAKTAIGDLSESALRNNVAVLMANGNITPAQGGAPLGGELPRPLRQPLLALPPRADGRQ